MVIPKASKQAAWGIIGLLVLFLTVHVHMLVNAEEFPEVHVGLLWGRLALQGLLMAWAYWFTR